MKYLFSLMILMTLMLACKSSKNMDDNSSTSEVPEQFKGKVLVTLLDKISPSELESDFTKYSLKHLAIASKSQNQHLFEFDHTKIETVDLLKKLNKSKKVYSAQALEFQINDVQKFQSEPKKNVDIK